MGKKDMFSLILYHADFIMWYKILISWIATEFWLLMKHQNLRLEKKWLTYLAYSDLFFFSNWYLILIVLYFKAWIRHKIMFGKCDNRQRKI